MRAGRGAAARLAIALPKVDAGEALALTKPAERFGIDGLWLGSLGPDGPMADRYAATTLAAIAAASRELRLGIILHGFARDQLAAAEIIHLAEDLSAVDNISNGRLEVAFAAGDPDWAARAETMLGIWTDGLELSDGSVVAATPAPVQPLIPRLVLGDDEEARGRLAAGRWLLPGGMGSGDGMGRTVLSIRLGEESVLSWLGAEPDAALEALREEVTAARAGEVVFILDAPKEDDLAALGTVVGPCLRCSPDQTGKLARLAFAWLREGAPRSARGAPDFAVDPE